MTDVGRTCSSCCCNREQTQNTSNNTPPLHLSSIRRKGALILIFSKLCSQNSLERNISIFPQFWQMISLYFQLLKVSTLLILQDWSDWRDYRLENYVNCKFFIIYLEIFVRCKRGSRDFGNIGYVTRRDITYNSARDYN